MPRRSKRKAAERAHDEAAAAAAPAAVAESGSRAKRGRKARPRSEAPEEDGVIGAPTVYDHLTKAQCKAIGEGRIRAVHAVCTVSSGDLVAALTSPDCIVRTLDLMASSTMGEEEGRKLTLELCAALTSTNRSVTHLKLNQMHVDKKVGVALGKMLASNPSITDLDLSHAGNAGPSGVAAIARALERNATLQTLSLEQHRPGAAGGAALGKALKANSTLTVLDLSYTYLDSKGMVAVAKGLEANRTLTVLKCGQFPEEDGAAAAAGGRAVAAMLTANTTLESIDVSGHRFGEEATQAIVQALMGNSAVSSANLGATGVGPAAGDLLAELVATNPRLTTLGLQGCGLEARACSLVVSALKSSAVTAIDLSENVGEASGRREVAAFAKAAAAALRTNTALTSVNLSGNEFDGPDGVAIAQGLQKRGEAIHLDLAYNNIGGAGASKAFTQLFLSKPASVEVVGLSQQRGDEELCLTQSMTKQVPGRAVRRHAHLGEWQ